jgi:uncharacterized protein YndB with AHSA1/START domain
MLLRMGGPSISASTVIAAPPAVVFAIVSDPGQHVRIDGSGSVRTVVRAPERLDVGSEFSVGMKLYGLPYRHRNRVVEYETDRLIAWRHWAPHRWRYEIEPAADGRSRVTETCDFTRYPGWGMAIARVMRWLPRNRRWMEDTLVRLKAAAESDARAERSL